MRRLCDRRTRAVRHDGVRPPSSRFVSRTRAARIVLLIALGLSLRSHIPVSAAGQLNGQLWFTVLGVGVSAIDGHINADGSNITTAYVNGPSAGPGPQDGASDLSIGLDLRGRFATSSSTATG